MTEPTLLERHTQRDVLQALLQSAIAGVGSSVVIEGEPGIGKSVLQGTAERTARSAGFNVLSARGGELERYLSWGLVRELFAKGLRESADTDGTLSGAAAVTAPLLGLQRGGDAAPSVPVVPEALNGFYWLVSNLCERSPVLISADDCQWADPLSLQFLTYMAPRTADLPVVVCVAARVGDGASAALLHGLTSRSTVLSLDPLTEKGSARLLAAELDDRPSPGFVRAAHALTGGNPFMLRALADHLRRSSMRPDDATTLELERLRPEAISRSIAGRLSALPAAARRLAAATSVLGRSADFERAADLSELDLKSAAAAAGSLSQASILHGGMPLVWQHPIVQNIVYELVPPPERALLHSRAARLAADAGDDVEQVAAHLLLGVHRADRTVVEALEGAATAALQRGAPDTAAEYLRRALAEPPPSVGKARLLVQLGEAEALAGSEQAVSRLTEAIGLLADPRERAAACLRLGWMLHKAGRFAEAAATLETGQAELGDVDDALASELESAFLGTAWLDPARAPAAHRRSEALLSRGLDPSSPLRRTVLTQAAVTWVFEGRAVSEVRAVATRLLAGGELVRDEGPDAVSVWQAVGCLSWSDALDEAEATIEDALAMARRQNSYVMTAQAYYSRAWPRYWRGRLAEAAADAEAAVQAWRGAWGMYLPSAEYWLCIIQLERADAEAAREALVLADETAWKGTAPYALWRAALGRLAAAEGDFAKAFEEQIAAGDICQGVLLQNPALLPWRSDAAVAASQLGRRDDALALAKEEVKLARAFGAPRSLGIALRGLGIVTGGRRGLTLLREAVSVLEKSPSRLEYCRALVDLGAALRRLGHRSEADDPLRAGLDLAEAFGAKVIADQALAELRILGRRPRRRRLVGVDALTPGELRVSSLAASGKTNREIAQYLLVSLRTVETHLTHAYGKLGVADRSGLRDALRGVAPTSEMAT